MGKVLLEVKSRLQQLYGDNPVHKQFSGKHVVGIKFHNATEMLDFWLTQHERPIPPLAEGDELEILYSGKAL